jgi:hypothetical protein
MKNLRTHIIATLAALFSAALVAQAKPNHFVRYQVETDFVTTGVDADATGQVQVFLKQQSESEQRRLRVRVSNLDTNATFTLQAIIGSNTPIVIATFTTSASGKATLAYVDHTSPKPPKNARPNKHALPENISDLTDVRTLLVVNANNDVVLSSDLHAIETLNYEVATAFTSTGTDPDAIGIMAAAVQNGTIQFRLFAMGQSSQYTLMVNDQPVANYFADPMGGIAVGQYPPAAPAPMQFRNVSLKNAADVVILESHVR